jgi:hypothetical protein
VIRCRGCSSLPNVIISFGLRSVEIPVDAGDFCVMDRAVIDVLKAMPERTRFVRGFAVGRGFVKWVWPTSVPCVMPAHRFCSA